MNEKISKFDVAIVMPILNEERYIGRTLEQIYMQDFPMDRLEVVIADGGSTDRTREIVESYRSRFGTLKLLDNAGRKPSTGRNVGVKNTSAPYVIILDGHCYIPDNQLLKNMLALFEQHQVDCLCRPQPLTPPDINEFEQAVAFCRGSLLGHKPGSEIFSDHEAIIDPTSSGAMYRREVFDQLGYFDEQFDACEDVDFNFRVHRSGMKAMLSPKLTVFYYPRSSIPGLWRQMNRYGLGRFRFSAKHRQFSPIQWLAGAGTAGFVFLAVLSLLSTSVLSFFRSAVGIYLLIVILFSLILALKKRQPGCLLYGPLIFPTIHFGLGTGFLKGLFEFLSHKKSVRPGPSI
ncbi:MAG: glycosyltransferase family 2 protein [bacterium]|nr:glycosyltransferase family 2 protein [bacterium]